jgi:hypothetical protein
MLPPTTLDGAKILCWSAALDLPFYYLKQGDDLISAVGFAIGQFDFSECFQLFTCAPGWKVINDRDALSLKEAMAIAQSQAHGHHLIWHRLAE